METASSFSASSTKKRQSNARPSALELALANAIKIVAEPHIGQGTSSGDQSKIEFNVQMQEAEMERCRKDIVYWCSNYVMTYDPRVEPPAPRETLFVPFPRQVELIHWALARRAKKQIGLVVKSRDSGVSIIFGCILGLHSWLFEDNFSCGFGAHIEEKVDRLGDMSSLFEKIRFSIRSLPAWMKPKGLKEEKHLLHRRLINPQNGSLMIAEIGDQCGRGGRNATYTLDEASFHDHPDLVEASLSANTNCVYYVSTPNGLNNWFARKRVELPEEQVFEYRWESDPRKTPEWKDKILREFGKIVFEREYNLNFAASVEGICIPSEWVQSAVNLQIPAEGDIVCGFDVAGEGDNNNVLAPRQGPVIHPLLVWKAKTPAESASIAARHAEDLNVTQINYDCLGPGEYVKGAWDTMAKEAEQDGPGLPFQAVAIIGGEKPSDMVWADGKTSKQKFANARAEIWWIMRTRFQKTYEYTQWLADPTKGALHPFEDLISIPNDPHLIGELSTPLVLPTTSGKIQIESKVQMRKRNVKCLALDTKIPTPTGWTDLASVRDGDIVFDDSGFPTEVVYATSPMIGHDCYRLEFSDGSHLVADAEHLWKTRKRRSGDKVPYNKLSGLARKTHVKYRHTQLRTTKEISETLVYADGNTWNHCIDMAGALVLPEAKLQINPYTFGVWLGDGDSDSPRITLNVSDLELLAHLEADGAVVSGMTRKLGTDNYRVKLGPDGRIARNSNLRLSLSMLGVLGNKHIPVVYLRSSLRQRTELLAGLLDTDGHVDARGRITISSSYPDLAHGIIELIISLGLKPYFDVWYPENGRPATRISFTAYVDTPVFKLARKLSGQKTRPECRPFSSSRRIVACDRIASVPVKCIKVAAPSGMFLAGENMIQTHNSPDRADACAYSMYQGEQKRKFWFS